MKTPVFAVIPLLITSPSLADFQSSLSRLDPQTRLEQVCDLEVMARIRRTGRYVPDRAKSYVVSEPHTSGHTLVAKGAAFRSNGQWYELFFTCKASSDHLKVLSIDYQIGKLIPEAKWDSYGLWK
jgi:hypothetical protein